MVSFINFIKNYTLIKAKHERRLRILIKYGFGDILAIGCAKLFKYLQEDKMITFIVPVYNGERTIEIRVWVYLLVLLPILSMHVFTMQAPFWGSIFSGTL